MPHPRDPRWKTAYNNHGAPDQIIEDYKTLATKATNVVRSALKMSVPKILDKTGVKLRPGQSVDGIVSLLMGSFGINYDELIPAEDKIHKMLTSGISIEELYEVVVEGVESYLKRLLKDIGMGWTYEPWLSGNTFYIEVNFDHDLNRLVAGDIENKTDSFTTSMVRGWAGSHNIDDVPNVSVNYGNKTLQI